MVKDIQSKVNYCVSVGVKHSITFILTIVLIIYLLIYNFLYSAVMESASAIINASFLIISALIFLYLFYKLFLTGCKISTESKRLFFIFFVTTFLSFLINFSGLEKIFGLSIILLSMMAIRISPMDSSERRIVYYLFVVAVGILLVNDLIIGVKKGEPAANGMAFYLAVLFCATITKIGKRKSILSFIIAIIAFSFQFLYGSRTAMLGCLLFLFFVIVMRGCKKTKTIENRKRLFYLIFLFSLLGLLLTYIYAEILYPAWGHGKFIIFGKDLFTGREDIWDKTFESVKANLLFGVGSHLNQDYIDRGYYELIQNAHNQPLGMLAAFGVIPFIFFYITFAHLASELYVRNRKVKYRRAPAIFLITITIMSYFDIYFFSQYNWLAIAIVYMIICSYSRE